MTQERIGDVQDAGPYRCCIERVPSIAFRQSAASESRSWQRRMQNDLGTAYNLVGNVQLAEGDLANALASYQAVLDIGERLAKSDQSNAAWQRDLAVAHEKIGDIQERQEIARRTRVLPSGTRDPGAIGESEPQQ